MNIVWHRNAEIDLSSLSDYIAEDNPSAALRVFRKVVTSAEQLSTFPRLGKNGRIEGTHELVVPGLPYIIVYRLSETEVIIVGIQHTSLLWPDSFPTE